MASLQQVVEQLALLATAGTNGTSAGATTSSSPKGPLDFLTSTLKLLFTASALRDWAVLLVIGSLFGTARGLLAALWQWLINSFFITAVFEEEDISFQWIMHWLSKQPSWKRARNVQISTSNFDLRAVQIGPIGLSKDQSPRERKVTYLPAVSESYVLWYRYHWMKITRTIESHRGGWFTRETLTIKIMTRDHDVLADILQDAKNGYIEAQKDMISIYVADRFISSNGWRELVARPKRSLNSIILDPGIIDLVVDDIRDFLDSKEWYATRGIPFRRGYLLHGAPGSGKTSLIHSIAGELGLDVYIVSLSRSGLDDTGLSELISGLPERCIALMEDVDAAFHHGLSRESPPDVRPPNGPQHQPGMNDTGPPAPTGNRVSLSGLLNALDGIGAQEGRVLFATTNKYSSLDPALCRPGRMDLHIEFKLASRFQAEELFKRFYAPLPPASESACATENKQKPATASAKHENGNVNETSRSEDLIDLSESQTPTTSPSSPPSSSPPSSPSLSEKIGEGSSSGPIYVGVEHRARGPQLSLDRVNILAAQFAQAIPERQLSMASLQGFLMTHKTGPLSAVTDVGAWVEKELLEKEAAEKVDEVHA